MAQTEWNPGRLLELSGKFWQTCTLHAAVKLDVFTVLGDDRLPAAEVADRILGDPRGVEMLLNALVAMQLLERSSSGYANVPSARDLLVKQSTGYIGHIIQHHRHLVPTWARLDTAVLTGKPVRQTSAAQNEEWRENFLMGMFNLAMGIAPGVAGTIDLSGSRRLLDLGGGPGTYAIYFCLQNHKLEATVWDLETSRPFAEKTIGSFELSDRIDFIGGDYLSDPIEGDYDAVWISHILHAEGPGDCQKLINKAVSAASPGAKIMVHDFILNDTMDGPLFPALFALNMLSGTRYGRAYSDAQIRDLMTTAGLVDIRRLDFQGPNDSAIIVAQVPVKGQPRAESNKTMDGSRG